MVYACGATKPVGDAGWTSFTNATEFLRHMYELREKRPLRLEDFAGLHLTHNQLGECIRVLKAEGWCDGHVHETSMDNSGVDFVAAWITPEGIEELGYVVP